MLDFQTLLNKKNWLSEMQNVYDAEHEKFVQKLKTLPHTLSYYDKDLFTHEEQLILTNFNHKYEDILVNEVTNTQVVISFVDSYSGEVEYKKTFTREMLENFDAFSEKRTQLFSEIRARRDHKSNEQTTKEIETLKHRLNELGEL